LNGYARQESAQTAGRALRQTFGNANVEAAELWLTAADGRRLSTGVVARCAFG
jgi:hypothetical protein